MSQRLHRSNVGSSCCVLYLPRKLQTLLRSASGLMTHRSMCAMVLAGTSS
jgi:hypothetical protein